MEGMIRFMKELQQERRTQPNDGNADPVFWVLRDYKWEITEQGYEDRVSIYEMDLGETIEVDEYMQEIIAGEHGVYIEEQITELRELLESDGVDGMVEWVKEHVGSDCYAVYEKQVPYIVINTLFITKKEAKEHIELYGYNYTDRVHTYAMTALRSPSVEKLLEMVEDFDWDKVKL